MSIFDWFKRKSASSDLPLITENSVDAELLGNISACGGDSVSLLGSDIMQKSPADIINAIDSFVFNWQKGVRPPIHPDDDLSLILGSLWGEQLVESLGWQWTSVTFHDHGDSQAVGVVTPDRSIAIYPFHFIYGCMENNAPVTIMLSYNMLIDGAKIPEFPAAGFLNLMEQVHHIIPRG
jgi:hypothetical protein